MHTRLCDLLGIEYPIIQAGMATAWGDPLLSASRAELVAAVSNAGGLGMIGGARFAPEELREEIRKTKQLTDKPFGVDLLLPTMASASSIPAESRKQLPAEHVAFVEKLKKELGLPDIEINRPVLTEEIVRRQVEVILAEGVAVFASGLGDPGWMVPDAHKRGMKVMALAGNVRNARRLAESGVDIIVAQGYEGGGHTGRIGTMALIPQVVDAVHPIPVVAAGGIGDGRGLVAALALGAIGVWCGTVFLATHEANVREHWKQSILEATDEDPIITRAYTGKTIRSIKNKFIETWDKSGLATLPYPLQGVLVGEIWQGLVEADLKEYMSGYAGQISGMIKEVKSARQVIEEMVEEATQILEERIPAEVKIKGNPL